MLRQCNQCDSLSQIDFNWTLSCIKPSHFPSHSPLTPNHRSAWAGRQELRIKHKWVICVFGLLELSAADSELTDSDQNNRLSSIWLWAWTESRSWAGRMKGVWLVKLFFYCSWTAPSGLAGERSPCIWASVRGDNKGKWCDTLWQGSKITSSHSATDLQTIYK